MSKHYEEEHMTDDTKEFMINNFEEYMTDESKEKINLNLK